MLLILMAISLNRTSSVSQEVLSTYVTDSDGYFPQLDCLCIIGNVLSTYVTDSGGYFPQLVFFCITGKVLSTYVTDADGYFPH